MPGFLLTQLIVYRRVGLIALLLSALWTNDQAQDTARHPPIIDLARTGLLDNLVDTVGLYFYPDKNLVPGQLPTLPFRQNARHYEHFLPPVRINGLTILQFTLTNSADTPVSAFFCPGFLIDDIRDRKSVV